MACTQFHNSSCSTPNCTENSGHAIFFEDERFTMQSTRNSAYTQQSPSTFAYTFIMNQMISFKRSWSYILETTRNLDFCLIKSGSYLLSRLDDLYDFLVDIEETNFAEGQSLQIRSFPLSAMDKSRNRMFKDSHWVQRYSCAKSSHLIMSRGQSNCVIELG